MRKVTMIVAVLLSASVLAGCVADRDGRYHRRARVSRGDDAWEIVQRDPCRRREYEDFAREHKNPDKRQRFVERLAREGCGRDDRDRDRPVRNEHRYDDPHYDPYR